MIAYWGDDYGKRHIVHKVNLGWLPAGRKDIYWVTLCGRWARNKSFLSKTKGEANCRVCLKVVGK